MRKAYLVLSDGSVYEGFGFGAETDAVGELVFNTGVVGYLETLTDPVYAGQIVMQTFPLVGNYGVIEEDFDGDFRLKGYVVREWCETPSNFRSQYNLDTLLKSKGIPGIYGLDTRALTRKIRECGVMNAMICASVPEDLSVVIAHRITGEVEKCSCKQASTLPAQGEAKLRAAIIDYGAVHGYAAELQKRGCEVNILPAGTSAEEILAGNYDGLLLSDGPGDPAENAFCIAQIAKLLGKMPVFGISLGHQLLALAAGARTEKMKHGNRGANQPVKEAKGTRTFITSQNHGYAVVADSIRSGEVSYININDGSCEGADYPALKAFGVQFQPQSCIGPQDTSFLYDRFISMMGGDCECR